MPAVGQSHAWASTFPPETVLLPLGLGEARPPMAAESGLLSPALQLLLQGGLEKELMGSVSRARCTARTP